MQQHRYRIFAVCEMLLNVLNESFECLATLLISLLPVFLFVFVIVVVIFVIVVVLVLWLLFLLLSFFSLCLYLHCSPALVCYLASCQILLYHLFVQID